MTGFTITLEDSGGNETRGRREFPAEIFDRIMTAVNSPMIQRLMPGIASEDGEVTTDELVDYLADRIHEQLSSVVVGIEALELHRAQAGTVASAFTDPEPSDRKLARLERIGAAEEPAPLEAPPVEPLPFDPVAAAAAAQRAAAEAEVLPEA